MQPACFEYIVSETQQGLRLDVYLTEQLEEATRSFIKKLIKDGRVKLKGGVCTRPARAMSAGEKVEVDVPPPERRRPEPEDIPLDILHEDEEVLIVNKPSGLVVHPAPGHYTGTLVNAVLHHCPGFEGGGEDMARPGIVHRLDQFTSGVMVVAKTQRAFTSLARQAHDHLFDRRYQALVRGEFKEDRGRVNAPIGRSLQDRKRMSVTGLRSKEAVTNFEVLERHGAASLVALQLETGRTHQIRVHMRFAGHPILGDAVYGVTDFGRMLVDEAVAEAMRGLMGQALHAELLGIEHPASAERMTFTAPPPEDFQRVLIALRGAAAS